jgi:YD repeat-containing protein
MTETSPNGVLTWNYGYDNAGRLTTAAESGYAAHTYGYTYDAGGNRTTEVIDGVD